MRVAVSSADIGRTAVTAPASGRSAATSVSTGDTTFLYDLAIAAEAIDVTASAPVPCKVIRGSAR